LIRSEADPERIKFHRIMVSGTWKQRAASTSSALVRTHSRRARQQLKQRYKALTTLYDVDSWKDRIDSVQKSIAKGGHTEFAMRVLQDRLTSYQAGLDLALTETPTREATTYVSHDEGQDRETVEAAKLWKLDAQEILRKRRMRQNYFTGVQRPGKYTLPVLLQAHRETCKSPGCHTCNRVSVVLD
jgi:hypothetical protein